MHEVAHYDLADYSSDDGLYYIGAVTHRNAKGNEVYMTAMVKGINVRFEVDTGSQVNIIPISVR